MGGVQVLHRRRKRGGGGGQRVCWPPSQIIGRAPPPLPTPMKHLNNKTMDTKHRQIQKEYLLKEV